MVGIFGVLLLCSLRFSSDYKEGVLSVDTTGRLEGVLVFVVILSHIAMSDYRLGIGSSSSMLVHVGALGRLAVSVFFFISGYGLLKQLQARKNAYIAQFVRHRIMPFMLSYFISALVYYPQFSSQVQR
nr:acyltransferase family protein [Lacticaseibacillus rhamnosus]